MRSELVFSQATPRTDRSASAVAGAACGISFRTVNPDGRPTTSLHGRLFGSDSLYLILREFEKLRDLKIIEASRRARKTDYFTLSGNKLAAETLDLVEADAITGAARLLRANGDPADFRRAIFAYNHAGWYVDRVMAKADEYCGQFAPGATGGARAVLTWAVAHVGGFTYSLGPRTDRGGTVQDMQTREPASSTCDCSMFVRWSMAQAGIDVGLTTVTQWTANGLLPSSETAVATPLVARGVGPSPPLGGYRPGDIVFFGHGPGGEGHDALWLGGGQIVQCSSSGGGSNIRPLAGYVEPTGWVRWRPMSG